MKTIHIIGGGTVFHIRPHLAISAVAYGNTAKRLADLCSKHFDKSKFEIICHLTKMANMGQGTIETNQDVKKLLDEICLEPKTSIIFLPVALCDFTGSILDNWQATSSGKDKKRLKSREKDFLIRLTKADKLISEIKKHRKDIILIGFKTTSKADKNDMVEQGQKLLAEASCDFVYVNDVVFRKNFFLGPNSYTSPIFDERLECLTLLIKSVHNLVKEV